MKKAGFQGELQFPHTKRSLAVRRALVQVLMAATDLVAMVLAIVMAGFISQYVSEHLFATAFKGWNPQNLVAHTRIWGVLVVGMVGWFWLHQGYSTRARRPFNLELKALLGALTMVVLLDGFIEYSLKNDFSRMWVFSVWPVAAILVPVSRIAVRSALIRMGLWQVNAIAIGGGDYDEMVRQLNSDNSYLGYEMKARLQLDELSPDSVQECSVRLERELRLWGAETVFLIPNIKEVDRISGLVNLLNLCTIPYLLVLPIQRIPFAGLTMQGMLTSDTILLTSQSGLLSPVRQHMKRAFDILISATLIVLLAPLFLLLGVMIARDGGPVFYGHKRVGKNGKPFACLKLRSMVRNSEEALRNLLATDPEARAEWERNFKLERDPRITRIGRFLRSSSLDELPQLFNVLKGEMSLVGPRPVVAAELEQYYGQDVHYYHKVRPGLTGLWQVSGRSSTTYERRVFLDAWYVRNWTLWLDVQIFFSTVPAVLAQKGAH